MTIKPLIIHHIHLEISGLKEPRLKFGKWENNRNVAVVIYSFTIYEAVLKRKKVE